MHFLISHWTIPAIVLVLSIVYLAWKAKGGSLFFNPKKNDDGTTTVFKLIFGMGWMMGTMIIGIWVAIISAAWLFVDLVAVLFGAR
jgi:hypothetical protein